MGIIKTAQKTFTKINDAIDNTITQGFNLVGLNVANTSIMKFTILSIAGTFVIGKYVYPPLKPHILRLVPDVDMSYKTLKTIENIGNIGKQIMKDIGIVAPLTSIAYAMSSQAKSKLESEGHRFIQSTIMPTDKTVKKPVYNQNINDKITDFEKIINNTTVSHNKNSNKIQSFLFHGPAGTGKTSIMNYLSNQFSKAVIKKTNGKTYCYTINSATLSEKLDWQLDHIVKFINGERCDIPMLHKEFSSANKNTFNTNKDAIIIEFDEIDQLGTDKIPRLQGFYDKLKNTNQNILFMGTTNHLDSLSEPLKNRIQNNLEIGLPTNAERDRILDNLCEDLKLTISSNLPIEIDGLSDRLKATDAWKDLGDNSISGRTISNVFEQTMVKFNADLASDNKDTNTAGLPNDYLEKIKTIFSAKLQEILDNEKTLQ